MKGIREEDTIAEGPKPLSLDSALQKATEGAFMHVRKKIQNASDLENLAQNRQSAYATHQEKIACLKARVQGLVTNIEMGIDDLDSTADNLYGLLRDIEHIQSESTHATSHFSGKHFEDLKSLATFWERIVQVDNLITQFRKTDNIIASIEKFFKDNPDGFSIKCFTAIDGLLTFEKELLLFTDDPQMKEFVEERFSTVHQAHERLLSNVEKIIENAFASGRNVDTDVLIRANWIMCAIGKEAEILGHIETSIRSHFQSGISEGITEASLETTLTKLNERIETLPEQLERILPALPGGRDDLDKINEMANRQIGIVLGTVTGCVEKKTGKMVVRLVKAMNEIECSLRALMCVEPNDDFKEMRRELEEGARDVMLEELSATLSNVIAIDDQSIRKKDGNILSTLAPRDLLRCIEEMDTLVQESELPSTEKLLAEMRGFYIPLVSQKLEELAERASMSQNMQYLAALMNNSFDGNIVINETAKRRSDLINKGQAMELRQAWIRIQKSAIAQLTNIMYSAVNPDGDFAFKKGFGDKLDLISDHIEDVKQWLMEPIFRKLQGYISRFLLAKLMVSYLQRPEGPEGKNAKQFEQKVTEDASLLEDFCRDMHFIACDNIADMCGHFKDMMTIQCDEVWQFYPIIVKEYTDFEPKVCLALLRVRPDKPKAELVEELEGNFDSVYANTKRREEDHIFTDGMALLAAQKITFKSI